MCTLESERENISLRITTLGCCFPLVTAAYELFLSVPFVVPSPAYFLSFKNLLIAIASHDFIYQFPAIYIWFYFYFFLDVIGMYK